MALFAYLSKSITETQRNYEIRQEIECHYARVGKGESTLLRS